MISQLFHSRWLPVPYKTVVQRLHFETLTDSRVHGAIMGTTWGRQDPGGPHVGPTNLAIRAVALYRLAQLTLQCVPLIRAWLVVSRVLSEVGFVRYCYYHAGKLHYHRSRMIVPMWFITVTSQWARWRLKSPTSRLFTQAFIQAQIKNKHQSSASLAFVRGIHRWPVNTPHRWPVMRKLFSFDDDVLVKHPRKNKTMTQII